MKTYTMSGLREQLAGAFDRAERGEPVVIARRGRRFRLVAEAPSNAKTRTPAFFKVTDPRLLETGWTWEWTMPGRPMRLKTAQRSSRKR